MYKPMTEIYKPFTVVMEGLHGYEALQVRGAVYGALATCRSPLQPRKWLVVHIPTGTPICSAPDQQLAYRALLRISALGLQHTQGYLHMEEIAEQLPTLLGSPAIYTIYGYSPAELARIQQAKTHKEMYLHATY